MVHCALKDHGQKKLPIGGATATVPRGSTVLPAKTTHGPCLSPAVPEPDLLVIVATDDDVVPAHHIIAVGKYIDGSGT